jgi:subtilisin family serine protease
MGANLSSNSWGGGGYSQALKDAINAAGAAGMLFVAAAGNSNSNNDTSLVLCQA